MIYVFRESEHSRMLEEFPSPKALATYVASQAPSDGGVQPYTWRRISAAHAHQWVRQGNIHNTGLWLDGGRIRYASAQYD